MIHSICPDFCAGAEAVASWRLCFWNISSIKLRVDIALKLKNSGVEDELSPTTDVDVQYCGPLHRDDSIGYGYACSDT